MNGRQRHLVLVGLMGSGKSSVGATCAERLGRPFVDTDALVESLAGRSVTEIFQQDGEASFRAVEAEAVAAAVAGEPAVIACGGGAVLSQVNRDRLRSDGCVVLLTAPSDVLAARVGAGHGRPLLADAPPAEALARLAVEREAAYQAVSDAVVDTAGRDVEAVASEVLDRFRELKGGTR